MGGGVQGKFKLMGVSEEPHNYLLGGRKFVCSNKIMMSINFNLQQGKK